jgi:hypothetical protein
MPHADCHAAFASLTNFVDHDDMYFGNDRLALVRSALLRRRSPLTEESNSV